jgi:23S rRNA pseudouridine1911/1915/1917 synthase
MSERRVVLTLQRPGERLDRVLADELGELSRSQVQRLLRAGAITIDGAPARASQRLAGGEHVAVTIPPAEPTDLVPEEIPLDIRYEDDDLVVVNKPAGMVVHPAAGHSRGTLVNAILAHCPDLPGIGGERRPGVVHRLDKDTSGLVVVAKNEPALRYLQAQFKQRQVSKQYLALVEGRFPQREALIDAPVGRDPAARKRMAVIRPGTSDRSRPAQTRVKVVAYLGEHTLLECQPITGRTHQIRVHPAHSGHPIVGDKVYGRRRGRLAPERHFLHAARLTFARPADGQSLTVEAPLPEELERIVAGLAAA